MVSFSSPRQQYRTRAAQRGAEECRLSFSRSSVCSQSAWRKRAAGSSAAAQTQLSARITEQRASLPCSERAMPPLPATCAVPPRGTPCLQAASLTGAPRASGGAPSPPLSPRPPPACQAGRRVGGLGAGWWAGNMQLPNTGRLMGGQYATASGSPSCFHPGQSPASTPGESTQCQLVAGRSQLNARFMHTLRRLRRDEPSPQHTAALSAAPHSVQTRPHSLLLPSFRRAVNMRSPLVAILPRRPPAQQLEGLARRRGQARPLPGLQALESVGRGGWRGRAGGPAARARQVPAVRGRRRQRLG